MADAPVEKYPLVQRHSIVDLSASNLLLKQEIPNSDKFQTRRVVASKRRPIAPSKLPRDTEQPSISIKTDSHPKDEKNPTVSIKYVMFREYQERSCAVYEPLVTYRALSSIRPLFDRCIDYLEQNQHNIKLSLINCEKESSNTNDMLDDSSRCPYSVASSSDSSSKETMFDSVLSNLENLEREYLNKLKQLELVDYTIMRLVRGIDIEHMRLYDFQLNLSMLKKHSKEEDREPSESSPSPWPTKMLERLETLEEAKKQLEELELSGRAICESLDNLVRK